MQPKVKGLTIIQLVEALNKHGFKNIVDLAKMPPNPILWSKNEWLFAVSVIAQGQGISEAQVKKRYPTVAKLLKVFNETLRVTGLIIQLQRIEDVSEKDFLKEIDKQKWDAEWVNRDIGKKHE